MGRFKAFDDARSIVHFVVSFYVALLDALFGTWFWLGATMLFVFWQLGERESWVYRRGDIVEWFSGMLLAVTVKLILLLSQA